MTTEERFTKIENTLEMVSENLSRHEGAIRDLIVVSRTLLESQNEMRDTHQRDHDAWREAHREMERTLDSRFRTLAEQSAETDKRLNALIEIVDGIIRRKNGEP